MAKRKVIPFNRNWINEVTPGTPFTLDEPTSSRIRPGDLSNLMTVDEVAQFLRVKRCSVYEWIYAKRIRFLRAGRHYRIPRSAVEEFLIA